MTDADPSVPHRKETLLEDEVLKLGYWREIGRCGLVVAESLHESASPWITPTLEDAATDIACLLELHLTIRKARRAIGEDLRLPEWDVSGEIRQALHQVYAHGPIPRELLPSSWDDVQPLWDRPIPDRVRGLAERTLAWFNLDELRPLSDEEHSDTLYVPLPDGPRQVRDAGLALFHYLADDTWMPERHYWPPPSL